MFGAQRLDAALKLHEPAGGPLENILALPGLGALDATLSLSGPRSAEQLKLALQAGELKRQAEGIFKFNEMLADLSFAFESAAKYPPPYVRWGTGALLRPWHHRLPSP